MDQEPWVIKEYRDQMAPPENQAAHCTFIVN